MKGIFCRLIIYFSSDCSDILDSQPADETYTLVLKDVGILISSATSHRSWWRQDIHTIYKWQPISKIRYRLLKADSLTDKSCELDISPVVTVDAMQQYNTAVIRHLQGSLRGEMSVYPGHYLRRSRIKQANDVLAQYRVT